MKLTDYYNEPNYIHYSNCHEDFLLLKKYLKPETKEILSVGSALDNSLSFLTKDDVKVHAFDFNPSQVYLGKLKICGITHLNYEEFLQFLGIKKGDTGDRLNLYNKISDFLDSDSKAYFDNHLFLIEEGIVNVGRFEQYFHIFREKVFPATCGDKNIRIFAEAPTLEAQRNIYKRKINTLRFKLMFKIFFSNKMMAKLGRDKEFFKYSHDKLPDILKKKVDAGFYYCLNKTNPYYGYVLNNYYQALPFYLEEENFNKIKANIKNITIEEKNFDEMLTGSYDFMNLSDIFEYMGNSKMTEYSATIPKCLTKGGIVCFWNMMNVRKLSGMKRIDEAEDKINDRAFFYRDFLVYEK